LKQAEFLEKKEMEFLEDLKVNPNLVDPDAPIRANVTSMFGLDIALPGAVFKRNWFDNPLTAGMYPSVAKMLNYEMQIHPSEMIQNENSEQLESEIESIDEELLGIAGEGTAKLSVLNVTNINGETKETTENYSNGRTLSRPGSARIQKGRR
jgi:hypothetical protein